MAAPTYQRDCRFDFVWKVTEDGQQSADVDWRVSAANRGRSGTVVVKGSGTYKARVESFPSGAVEFVFKTDASTETMTISANHEALWKIDFNNGDMMAYAGLCKTPRKTAD